MTRSAAWALIALLGWSACRPPALPVPMAEPPPALLTLSRLSLDGAAAPAPAPASPEERPLGEAAVSGPARFTLPQDVRPERLLRHADGGVVVVTSHLRGNPFGCSPGPGTHHAVLLLDERGVLRWSRCRAGFPVGVATDPQGQIALLSLYGDHDELVVLDRQGARVAGAPLEGRPGGVATVPDGWVTVALRRIPADPRARDRLLLRSWSSTLAAGRRLLLEPSEGRSFSSALLAARDGHLVVAGVGSAERDEGRTHVPASEVYQVSPGGEATGLPITLLGIELSHVASAGATGPLAWAGYGHVDKVPTLVGHGHDGGARWSLTLSDRWKELGALALVGQQLWLVARSLPVTTTHGGRTLLWGRHDLGTGQRLGVSRLDGAAGFGWLQAAHLEGHRFAWSSQPEGGPPDTYRVVLGSLEPPDLVSVDWSPGGEVRSQPAGISCGRRCQHRFKPGEQVVLRATPRDGWRVAGWTGPCRSLDGLTCEVLWSGNPGPRSLTPRFVPRALQPSWARRLVDLRPSALAVDPQGRTVVAATDGPTRAAVVTLDAAGRELRRVLLEAGTSLSIADLATDSRGDVLVAATVSGPLQIDGRRRGGRSTGLMSGVLAKLSGTSGRLRWLVRLPDPDPQRPGHAGPDQLALLPDDSVALLHHSGWSGRIYGGLTPPSWRIGEGHLSRYHADGRQLWTRRLPTGNWNSLHMAGSGSGELTVVTEEPEALPPGRLRGHPPRWGDSLLMRFDARGELRFARTLARRHPRVLGHAGGDAVVLTWGERNGDFSTEVEIERISADGSRSRRVPHGLLYSDPFGVEGEQLLFAEGLLQSTHPPRVRSPRVVLGPGRWVTALFDDGQLARYRRRRD